MHTYLLEMTVYIFFSIKHIQLRLKSLGYNYVDFKAMVLGILQNLPT